jgi:hypothetical protein
VRLVIQPNPDSDVRAAIQRAVEEALPRHPAYGSRWRKAGLVYAAGRPRKRRGAARA